MSKYSDDAVKLFRAISDVNHFGYATPDGFNKRVQFVKDNQYWIQTSDDHQMMPVMALPDLLPWIEDPQPTTLAMAIMVKPSIVYSLNYDWLSLSRDQIVAAMNNSTVFAQWVLDNDGDLFYSIVNSDEYDYSKIHRLVSGTLGSMSFPEYCVFHHFTQHEDLHWNDVRQHPFASNVHIKPHLQKFNQKPFDLTSMLPDILKQDDSLSDMMKYCTIEIQHNKRGPCAMEDVQNKFAVFTLPKSYMYSIVDEDIVDDVCDELFYKNFMSVHPDHVVMGWVRFSHDEDNNLLWIDEVQSRLRFGDIYLRSNIPKSEWKKIEQHLLSNFLMLIHQSFNHSDTTVWLPTIKYKQQATDDQPSEVYSKFPKRIGFTKEIIENVGSTVDGTKGWRIVLDSNIL